VEFDHSLAVEGGDVPASHALERESCRGVRRILGAHDHKSGLRSTDDRVWLGCDGATAYLCPDLVVSQYSSHGANAVSVLSLIAVMNPTTPAAESMATTAR